MKKFFALFFCMLLLVNTFGCTENNNPLQTAEIMTNKKNTPSLGGIKLGDTFERVVEKLGKDYIKEIVTDEIGNIGEDMLIITYKEGIEITFGSNSKKVLFVVSSSQKYKTNLNIKVGDTADEINCLYEKHFDRFEGYNSEGPLDGWYLVDNDSIMIFDYKKSGNSRVNEEVLDDSKCEEIELAYYKYFD